VRKLLALLAALALLVTPTAAMAAHKNGHKVPPGAAKNSGDCAIEIDPLGVCLG
jgi:hypothetical protein